MNVAATHQPELSPKTDKQKPPRAKRPRVVCLRGFDPALREEAAARLRERGHRPVRSIDSADLILAGPDAERALVGEAEGRGLKLVTWDAFTAKIDQAHGGAAEGGSAIDAGTPETAPPAPPLPFLERLEGGAMRILGRALDPADPSPEDRRLVPTADRFAGICLDQGFADALGAALLGAADGYPVALEGATAASKTTAVLWLASVLGQPVARLNLNGQTDAGELVGRYVPADGSGGLAPDELLAHAEALAPESRQLLERARAEGRAPTPAERALVARNERLPSSSWRFQESLLPRSLRRGWWLLLDEINLAEPQILERLNSVLENPPTLVLSEGDGTVFGAGGDLAPHGRFRLFATLNPAEYSGRSLLSPAFRDRWTVWHQATTPGEPEIRAMLRHALFGEHPVVSFRGRSYQAAPGAPLPGLEGLAGLPDIDDLLARLAMFHDSVAKAAGAGGASGLGRHQREPLVVTRRAILALLEFVRRRLAEGEPPRAALGDGLGIFYVDRLRDPADRKAVRSMLKASGLA